MSKREWTRPCAVCGCEITNRSYGTKHPGACPECGRKCGAEFQKASRNFEPQRIVETPPVRFDTAAADSRGQQPPKREPDGRPWNDLRNNAKFNKARQEVRDDMRGMAPFRSAIYDLETTDLNGQIGRILCGVVLVFDPEELYVFRADNYDAWKDGRRSDDREIAGDILSVLECCDVHYAHNGRWFDQKFLATRAIAHNFKPVTPQKLVDPCQKARMQFALASNSLESVADHLGIEMKKTPFESNIWAKAMLDGDQGAMNYIVEHCVIDVYVLAQIARKISPWVKQIDNIGSFR
jgi:uncharacterized protein YprB with RNaseH-like and TPR domain